VKRWLALLVLLPGPALADRQLQVNPAPVHQCLAQAATGQIAPACLGQAANACQDQPGGQSTLGITECLRSEAGVWDTLLNAQYKKLRARFRSEGGGRAEALLKAQRAWIAFRDAQCALDYTRWGDGSMRSIAAATCEMEMTAARTIQLRDMDGNR
jgi:uncharacterized protein YecT (DUF1311 family)